MKHFIDIDDLDKQQLEKLIDQSIRIKKEYKTAGPSKLFVGKTLGLYFQKPSLRTRMSFEAGMHQLGGSVCFVQESEIGLGNREPIKDVARVVSRYFDAFVIRTFAHEDIIEFARYATIPVINALTDYSHPCQALADMVTIKEVFGKFAGLKMCYVGDGNNMFRSLLHCCQLLDIELLLSCPQEYALPGVEELVCSHIREAVKDAHIVYTDVWTSMGQEKEHTERIDAFKGYQIDREVMQEAADKAVFMHCLPAHRGEEVSDAVMESEQSIVFDQAENRLHAQKAVLLSLMNSG